jgi:hypothetical protein
MIFKLVFFFCIFTTVLWNPIVPWHSCCSSGFRNVWLLFLKKNIRSASLPRYLPYLEFNSSDIKIATCHSYCYPSLRNGLVWFMVFNTTFNNIPVILWWSVLLMEETGVPRENHRNPYFFKTVRDIQNLLTYFIDNFIENTQKKNHQYWLKNKTLHMQKNQYWHHLGPLFLNKWDRITKILILCQISLTTPQITTMMTTHT